MDNFISHFPETWRLPLGDLIDSLVGWLLREFGPFFDAIADGISFLLLWLERSLLALPWPILVVAVALAGWLATRRLVTSALLGSIIFAVGLFGLWDEAMRTLAIVLTGVILSAGIGVPLGVLAANSRIASAIMRPVLDSMQTMPIFVYLVPAMMFFGMGKVPALVATVVFAMPPSIRLTDLGIRQVSPHAVEAARAFGSTRWQILLEVQLPLALPSIMAGINQTTMMALSMVVTASMIGARGLGLEVLRSIQRIEVGRSFEAGLAIVCIAVALDRILQGVARSRDGAGR